MVRVVGWVLMIAMAPGGGGLKVVRVLLVLGGGGGFVRADGRCGLVHGSGGGKGGAEEVVEWEHCCYGGNERSSNENIGSPV